MALPLVKGDSSQSTVMEALRLIAFAFWFNMCCTVLHIEQLALAMLYFVNHDWFYTAMAFSKRQFGILLTTITQFFIPTVVHVSGDESVRGQIKQTDDGKLAIDFPERMVFICNHQIYTEWLYLWWIAYMSRMHGAVHIILKDSLRWIPVLGPGMMLYGFIFLARSWATDQARLTHRLQKLNAAIKAPLSHARKLMPMWLLIFPEGTNLSARTRAKSQAWALKSGGRDYRNLVMPRSTGLLYCLKELKGTVDWIYDCTIAYEGVARGQYAQDLFTIRSTFFRGRSPKSVSMHWRRIAVAEVPLDDAKQFEKWLEGQWRQKDALIDHYLDHGSFPAKPLQLDNKGLALTTSTQETPAVADHVVATIGLQHWSEIGLIFILPGLMLVICGVLSCAWSYLSQRI